MNAFALLLAVAAVAYGLAKFFRLPSIPLLIGGGMALRLSGVVPPGLEMGEDGAGDMLELGLVFLVFASGVELNPGRFNRFRAAVLWVAAVQFALAMGVGFLCAKWMGLETLEAVYMGGGLAASSTLVVLRHLMNRKAMFEPYGRVVTGVLLVQDVALVLLIVLLSQVDGGGWNLGKALVEVSVMGGFAWVAQKFVIPKLVFRFKPDEENLLLWLVAVLLAFVGVAAWLGLPLISGAFAGGFVFSAFPLNGLVRGQLSSLVDFFQAMFFVALGALLGVPDWELWAQAGVYSLVVVVVTPPLVALVAEWRGLNARAGIESGLLLAQTSEYSILLAISGLMLGHVSVETFSVLALTTVITMALTPMLGREEVANFLLPFHPLRKKKKVDVAHEGHVLILGFGSAGMWTVKPLLAQGEKVLVVDDDAVVCAALAKKNIPFLRGDGAESEVLEKAGAKDAKLIIASMRRVGDAVSMLEHVRGVPVLARVFEEVDAEKIRKAGGVPVMNSMAAADTFMNWLENNDRVKG
ncbi:MAG: cation:proton antiporter [Akkermansiaceae bacterium]|jgi:Kef-type K+ transport system membrane component KefB|nr:cation:proton antiporter [Akkermansiaceae bacterium]MDP4646608.1 cation:proton antiporter [Akkermansiaceae bacterium]MDP4720193.1 cation:proton antiporter [Akkermansiaceae bacterium]MDP4779817.1 cation:proton antiporter [Akkermansiaceae bacterium]MDP4846396.1 cation:proton antiporter [Akkermansiaceae bacterium]